MNKENDKNTNEKKKQTEVGSLPVNSRIYINYKESPPKITFDYPDKSTDQITWSSATMLTAMVITLIIGMIASQLWFLFINVYIYPDIGPGNITINSAEVGRFSTNYSDPNATHYGFSALYVNYTWHDTNYHSVLTISNGGFLWYSPYFIDKRESQRSLAIALQAIIAYVLLIATFILCLKLATRLFKNTRFGNRVFPEMNKFMHDKHYHAEFTPTDVPADKNIIELPMFKNMYMDYEATGEFSKYLTNISIIEHPFSKYVKKKGKPYTKIRKVAKKNKDIDTYNSTFDKKVNIYLWKAVFEFSDKPTTGTLKIKWT